MRALVVEDEKDIRSFLKTSLAAEHFAVDTAEDGEKGSYLARINSYDVIVLVDEQEGLQFKQRKNNKEPTRRIE